MIETIRGYQLCRRGGRVLTSKRVVKEEQEPILYWILTKRLRRVEQE